MTTLHVQRLGAMCVDKKTAFSRGITARCFTRPARTSLTPLTTALQTSPTAARRQLVTLGRLESDAGPAAACGCLATLSDAERGFFHCVTPIRYREWLHKCLDCIATVCKACARPAASAALPGGGAAKAKCAPKAAIAPAAAIVPALQDRADSQVAVDNYIRHSSMPSRDCRLCWRGRRCSP